jgi:chorismate mutase
MADTTKLSVGKAIERLRGTEEPKSRMMRLDEKIDALDKETQSLRAMRRSLGQKAGPTKRD